MNIGGSHGWGHLASGGLPPTLNEQILLLILSFQLPALDTVGQQWGWGCRGGRKSEEMGVPSLQEASRTL